MKDFAFVRNVEIVFKPLHIYLAMAESWSSYPQMISLADFVTKGSNTWGPIIDSPDLKPIIVLK